MEEMNGSLQQAANRLGVTDRTLQMRRAAPLKDALLASANNSAEYNETASTGF